MADSGPPAVMDGYPAEVIKWSDVQACVSSFSQSSRSIARGSSLLTGNQRQATTEAPPFATIARKPDFDVNRLATFLLNTYPRMPNMSLTRSEAAIAAYIGSLRK
jgi:hypothetical protein